MAKRSQKEGSGFTMSALIRQVLMDGKVHSIEEISEHVQKYMCKTISPDIFQGMIQKVLEQDEELSKTRKGYKLKSGESVQDLVVELISTADTPLLEKDIIKLVAKEQKLPPQTVSLELDDDKRFSKFTYKNKDYFYLAKRKKINSKVHSILAEKDRALTTTEIYKLLDTDHALKKTDVIFLPRDDRKIRRLAGGRFALKTAKSKKIETKQLHNVSKAELDAIVDYLQRQNEKLSAGDISEKILNIPLDNTNLRIKLTRDSRLKREKDLFYFEQIPEEIEIPPKVRERVSSQYFKVKARLVGSFESYTVERLLDLIYKVNLSHQEYDFYREVLTSHLMQDEGAVLTTDGWIQADADPRHKWTYPKSFEMVNLPALELNLDHDKLTEELKQFLNTSEVGSSNNDQDFVFSHQITSSEKLHGVLPLGKEAEKLLPLKPSFFELTMIDLEDLSEHTVFFHRPQSVILSMETVYDERCAGKCCLISIRMREESQYALEYRLTPLQEKINLISNRVSELQRLADADWDIYSLLVNIFQSHPNESISVYQIFAEFTIVRAVNKTDLLAALMDYKCFVEVEASPGYFSYDETKGSGRYTVAETPEPIEESYHEEVLAGVISKVEPAKAVTPKEPDESKKEPVPESPPIAEKTTSAEIQKVEAVKQQEESEDKQALKRRVKRKRPRPSESIEDLPDHIKLLKTMGRRLPRLQAPVSSPAQSHHPHSRPQSDTSRPRVSAASAGRNRRADMRDRSLKSKAPEIPMLLKPETMPETKVEWDANTYLNPEKGSGHAELNQAIEVLKAFITREPLIRKKDGSIVLFLDANDLALYFRIPPENSNCWLVWIPEEDIKGIEGTESFLTEGKLKAKHSDNGYWWCTAKFKGPRGNWKDHNVLEGVQILAKIIELMDKKRK